MALSAQKQAWAAMTLPAQVAETHVSWVFFVADRAYKLKKPVRFGFVDLTTRQAREMACRREVELNRRLSPDVYLGVLDVVDDGVVKDHLVEMRRMPAERRLSALVRSGEVSTVDIVGLADFLARFHLQAPHVPGPDLAELWERSFEGVRPFVPAVLQDAEETEVERLARRYVRGRRSLFDHRQDDGFVRDGHGDLLADDIFLLDDGPRVLDCLEFDDELRYSDILGDVAFLAMDLERLGSPALAQGLVEAWARIADPTYPRSLLHHYMAYRAHIRCKVACLRADQGDQQSPELARSYLSLALRHLERGSVSLVLVGGSPGSGKSTVASHLARELDAIVVRSDEVRARLAIDPAARYTDESKTRVYTAVIEEARHHLRLGQSVVADATWADSGRRALARVLAAETDSDLVELCCRVDAVAAAERVRRRERAYSSEATPKIALEAAFEPWPEATPIDTGSTVEESMARARAVLNVPSCR